MNRVNLPEVLGALAALVLGCFAAMAVTWPMVKYIDTIVLGGGELGGWLWRYNWHFISLDGVMDTSAGPLETWRAFVGLGRYPETGNILDVLAISYPLERWFGFPTSYNLKILFILSVNGLSGYALARYFSGSISAALAASVIAVVNPLTLFEIQSSGLRQSLLWWVLLYPALIDRALRRRTVGSGVLAGACFGMAGAFYWFYGLFAGLFTAVWLVKHALVERGHMSALGIARSLVGVGIGVALLAGPFILPYALGGDAEASAQQAPAGGGGGGPGGLRLPELTFFLPFPPYDTVSQAPMRPVTYAENVLASIHRTIGSSWSATYPFDPTLNESLPLIVMIIGVLPALTRRRSWGWLAVWLFFYLGTLGPFLRIGAGDNQNVYRVMEDYVVRMPYAWMFQFVPGMSRMFAPYRLASFVVVASVVLVALGLARFRWRAWLAPFVIFAIIAQPMYRWDKGSVNEGDTDSRELRSPIKANRIRVPDFYKSLDATALTGIVELPLEQQQDLTCYYQIIHGQKVYRSWASPGSIPPILRAKDAGGAAGERLRFLARSDSISGPIAEAWMALSHTPDTANLDVLGTSALPDWAKNGNYTLAILHERGYFLVDPTRGAMLYETANRRLAEVLGAPGEEIDELKKGDPANPEFGVPIIGDLVPWTSQPAELPPERAPGRYRMSVFRLPTKTLDTLPAGMD